MNPSASNFDALTGFIDHFKGGMGTTAVTTFIGIIIAFIAVLIILIILASGKSDKLMTFIACVVAFLVFCIAKPQHISFKLSLLGYALVATAVFLGFIYNDGRESSMRALSIAIFAAACYIKYRFY